jgi:isoleucyl-tRNA synthetase
VKEDLDYAFVDVGDAVYVLARSALGRFPGVVGKEPTVLATVPGRDLVGTPYTPLFPYFADRAADGRTFRVVAADFVELAEGVGVVHIAPAFGEEDYHLCRQTCVEMVNPVDARGCFTDAVKDFAGRHVLEANPGVLRRMKEHGQLVDHKTMEHNYPHCWRCRTPLIYRAMDAWYFSVETIKDALLRENRNINWVPETVRDGRFGKWLENARDWNISRNRFWGTPMPIWICQACDKRHVPGSIAEIRERGGRAIEDLHKEVLDEVTFDCECGGTCRRTPEVLDCWFESAAMPYAQNHYPFENREWFESHFPCDFIVEYTGQIRCWFYYMHVLAVALFDKPAFRTCIVHGTILAKDGKKISKSKRNYTDPMELMLGTGTDSLRLYLLQSNAAIMGDLNFDDNGVKSMIQKALLPLWNAYSFLVSYANVDGWRPGGAAAPAPSNPLDRWILARLHETAARVTERMDAYHIDQLVPPLLVLIDDLTNWYVRRSRRRFWAGGLEDDKRRAYETLHYALVSLVRLLAPAAPIIAEAIHRNLTDEESVHLSDWPEVPACLASRWRAWRWRCRRGPRRTRSPTRPGSSPRS